MVNEAEILAFFQKELPTIVSLTGKREHLGLDDSLQEYSEVDDLVPVIDLYSDKFNVDISAMNIENYYPWIIPWFFRKWFTRKPVKQKKSILTVRMFAESAKTGRWIYP
ncbi:hypothetical protein Xvie_02001 [Xenorhabdus vietnamensis]|uniref:Cytoplasmic protein n=1 Tax=Xenorhabdus vietnamensis TaxID=351656 RepID=A0A1Y2SE42_9GAMM|nr:DUF1493 family protein [Xenorhabdus vietnamensis]OTA16231.1 hypothetical protein Xvie_02001 [Xenorhabdus vietnamensis]